MLISCNWLSILYTDTASICIFSTRSCPFGWSILLARLMIWYCYRHLVYSLIPFSNLQQIYLSRTYSRLSKDFQQKTAVAALAPFLGDLRHLLVLLLHEAKRARRGLRSIGLVLHASDRVSSAFLRDFGLLRHRLLPHGCVTLVRK